MNRGTQLELLLLCVWDQYKTFHYNQELQLSLD